jgi:hypothetical protein
MNNSHDDASYGDAGSGADPLARGLGWFSLALGALEVLAPAALARTLGMRGQEGLLRAYGVREILSGVGILASEDPRPWIWARVAGDALDVATLARGLDGDNRKRGNVALALAAVAGVTVLDVICGRSLRSTRVALPVRDYHDRSGLPRAAEEMRGAAHDFDPPADMRQPPALRPYTM